MMMRRVGIYTLPPEMHCYKDPMYFSHGLSFRSGLSADRQWLLFPCRSWGQAVPYRAIGCGPAVTALGPVFKAGRKRRDL